MTEDIKAMRARLMELEGKERTKNVKTEVDKDGILIIEIDLTKDFGKSKKGKSTIVASTGGFLPIGNWEEGVALNLNVVKR